MGPEHRRTLASASNVGLEHHNSSAVAVDWEGCRNWTAHRRMLTEAKLHIVAAVEAVIHIAIAQVRRAVIRSL